MAKGGDHFDVHFQDILDNIDIKLITPFLTTSGIISADIQTELEKALKKPAVKLMLRKVRNHTNGNVLFKDCLTKTSESQGHQNLLSILYNPKHSYSGIRFYSSNIILNLHTFLVSVLIIIM